MKTKVLFCDLDGTLINTISGGTFPKGVWDMHFRFSVLNAIKNYEPDYICIVSNQGGIEKGFVNSAEFENKLQYITDSISSYTGCKHVNGYYCSSNDKENEMRKPNPGMLKRFFKFNDFLNKDICDILMIGDASGKEGQFSDSDKKTAENFGIPYMDVEDFVLKYES